MNILKRSYYSRYQPVCVEASDKLQSKSFGISKKIEKFISGFEIDDIILIAIIFILITDEQPDFITILALLYIFLV